MVALSCYDAGKIIAVEIWGASMGRAEKARFAHRLTESQQFESICLRCFRTVGSSDLEPGLEHQEAMHVCLAEDVIRLHGRMGPEAVRGERRKEDLA